MVAWHSSWTSVFCRRTFPVLRSTCIWRVTSYITKSSAACQPARTTQCFILTGSRNELWTAIGCPLWWMLTGWRPGVVDWGAGVLTRCLPRVQLFVSTCNGRPHLALLHHWLLPINCHFDCCKARLVRFSCKTRYKESLALALSFSSIYSGVTRWVAPDILDRWMKRCICRTDVLRE